MAINTEEKYAAEIGNVYGDFKVLKYLKDRSKIRRTAIFLCKCINCGREIERPLYNLQRGDLDKCKVCHPGFRVDKEAMIGQIFGLLKVVDYDEEKSKEAGRSIFKCVCQGTCGGNIVYRSASELNNTAHNSLNSSCGCSSKGIGSYHTIPTLGLKFGDIKVIGVDEEKTRDKNNTRGIYYIGKCSRGHIHSYVGTDLRNKHICPSCGC